MENITVIVIDTLSILKNNSSIDGGNIKDYEDLSILLSNPLNYSIVMTVIGILGCVLNTVALQVIIKSKVPSPFKSTMVVLTIMDLIHCFGLLPKFFIGSDKPHYVLISHMFENFGGEGSTWFTTLLTVERYGAVCKPFEHLSWWTKRKLIVVTTSMIIFITLANLPGWYFYLRAYEDTVTHKLQYGLTFYWLIGYLSETIFCGTTIIFCNCAIFRKMLKPTVVRKSSKNSTNQPNNQTASLTKLTMLVCFVFLSLHLFPKLLFTFLPFILNGKHSYLLVYPTILTGLNAAINSIVYCAAARNMRKKYFQILCCKTR